MKVAVLGGGVAGLLASRACVSRGLSVDLYDPQEQLGGGLLQVQGGLKYLHPHPLMARLLMDLGLTYDEYPLSWGVLEQDQIYFPPFPSADFLKRAQMRHSWTEEESRLLVSPQLLIQSLLGVLENSGEFNHIISNVRGVWDQLGSPVVIGDSTPSMYPQGMGVEARRYDAVITTLPLDVVLHQGVFPALPVRDYQVAKLNVAQVHPYAQGLVKGALDLDVFRDMDYVYTPWLRVVHRVSWTGTGEGLIRVEGNGDFSLHSFRSALLSDLSEMFGGSYLVRHCDVGLRGHLIPRPSEELPLQWPSRVYPLGMYAEWDPRATVDRVWSRALMLVEEIAEEMSV